MLVSVLGYSCIHIIDKKFTYIIMFTAVVRYYYRYFLIRKNHVSITDLVKLHYPIRDGVYHGFSQVGPTDVDGLSNQLLSQLE